MQNYTVEQLQQLAEIEFPLDGVTCAYKKKKILYKREQWVKARIADQGK